MTKQVEMVRVTEVEPLGGFVLRLRFNDDTERVVDLEDELWGPVFQPLKEDPELFRAVRLEGESIAWPNEADLAPEFLHTAGRQVEPSG